jgi:hypothetical protein
MAGNLFRSLRDKIENSPWCIPIFGLFCLGVIIGGIFMYEDLMANFYAYKQIPTHKTMGDMALIMALALQLAPLFLFVLFLFDDENPTKLGAGLFFLLVDWGIGIYYRNPNQGWEWLVYAAIEDLIFFTFGSEVLLVISVGMVGYLFMPFLRQLKFLIGHIASGGHHTQSIPQSRPQVVNQIQTRADVGHCECCNKPVQRGQKYCSNACKQKAYREREQENGEG